MNRLISLVFGAAILALPMTIAATLVILIAAAVPLLPLVLPLTTSVLLGTVTIAWIRWQRLSRSDERLSAQP